MIFPCCMKHFTNFIYYNIVAVCLLTFIIQSNSQVMEGDALKRLHCSLGLNRDGACPIDGSWSAWKDWQKCVGECGQPGHRTRLRVCDNPSPKYGGAQCFGSNSETESCILPGCTEKQYWKLVEGEPLRAGQFEVIKAVHQRFPALSDTCLTNDCRFETVRQALHDNAMQYWNALHCVKHAVGCPVRGGWSKWDPWSPCSAICGLGSKFRSRNCTRPSPTTPELSCRGSDFETQTCTGVACAPKQDGVWSDWGKWPDCSVQCGAGIKRRERECLKNPNKREEKEDKLLMDMESSESVLERLVRALDAPNICSGPNKEVQQCRNKDCPVNGGWSTWESWSPCSADCGLGAQSRSRTCSSPPPTQSGSMCSGLVTEVRRCFERPCTVKTHLVAVLTGDGALLYWATGRPSRLLQMYMRFLPFTPYGILVYRYNERCLGLGCDYVSLALEGGFLVLSAQVSGCSVTTISQSKLSIGEWHEVLFTVTGIVATMRVDDFPERSVSQFNCEPVLPELDQEMRIGERFHGQIQQIAVNYSPVRLRREVGQGSRSHRTGAAPYSSSNVVYEVAEKEEGFIKLVGKEIIRAPCPANPDNWKVELAVKPEKSNSLLLYIPGEDNEDYIMATLEKDRVKLRYRFAENHSEIASAVEIFPGKWLHLLVNRELLPDEEQSGDIGMSVNGDVRIILPNVAGDNNTEVPLTCKGDIIIGDVTADSEKILKEQSPGLVIEALTGILGYLAVDDSAVDLESLPIVQDKGFTFSTHTASFADHYEEIPLLLGHQLNLTCVYNTGEDMKGSDSREATWLRLDVPVTVEAKNDLTAASFSVKENGKVTHLTAASYPSRAAIEGFFTCWVHRLKSGRGHNLVAYGITVIDPTVEFNTIPVKSMEILGALAVVILVLYLMSVVVQTFMEKGEKFGLYQNFFPGNRKTKDDIFENMLRMIRSPKGRMILGSDEEVRKSENRIFMQMNGQMNVPKPSSSVHSDLSAPPPIHSLSKSRISSETKSFLSKLNKPSPNISDIVKQSNSDISKMMIKLSSNKVNDTHTDEKNVVLTNVLIQEPNIFTDRTPERNILISKTDAKGDFQINPGKLEEHPTKKVQILMKNLVKGSYNGHYQRNTLDSIKEDVPHENINFKNFKQKLNNQSTEVKSNFEVASNPPQHDSARNIYLINEKGKLYKINNAQKLFARKKDKDFREQGTCTSTDNIRTASTKKSSAESKSRSRQKARKMCEKSTARTLSHAKMFEHHLNIESVEKDIMRRIQESLDKPTIRTPSLAKLSEHHLNVDVLGKEIRQANKSLDKSIVSTLFSAKRPENNMLNVSRPTLRQETKAASKSTVHNQNIGKFSESNIHKTEIENISKQKEVKQSNKSNISTLSPFKISEHHLNLDVVEKDIRRRNKNLTEDTCINTS